MPALRRFSVSLTFGCTAIHLWRAHAASLTSPLAAALLCLTILVSSVAVKDGADGRDSTGRTMKDIAIAL